ncbi:MAG: lipase family protein, partial [Chlamydiae bacterium]|nr:lipase family protein [Chlamydiota bacterium]
FCKNKTFLQISTAEVLSKVIAFRNLQEGMTVDIPYVDDQGIVHIIEYKIDKIFDLWLGMPAFGLVDHKGIGAPILLYRGTDMSLHKKRGWASLFSDLDIQGPGLKAFLNARNEISSWLKRHSLSGKKTRVFGYSLGGVLCTYTILYEHENLDVAQSMAFSPPGVSSDTYTMWMKLNPNIRESYRIFVSHGDIIPKVGKMVGKAYEHSLEFHLRPLDAHVRLMCCQPNVYQFLIDIDRENKEGR